MQQYTTLLYLFDSFIKKVGSINITLEQLSLKAIGKKLNKKKALFSFF